ncbi:uncharacterized protein H6S33_001046 [Morchella sextelata]|uniref:uncharacterized protein n=1 Tax=Morchella sextelata TaxID=1174677 RepID=UPI001D03C7DC|nr:uncharacterized protein H6S33_001046 [Morchella sextelata]KAH0608818.1 hypothetical protein H6S33_001046 [Morchella sextelata]
MPNNMRDLERKRRGAAVSRVIREAEFKFREARKAQKAICAEDQCYTSPPPPPSSSPSSSSSLSPSPSLPPPPPLPPSPSPSPSSSSINTDEDDIPSINPIPNLQTPAK